MDIKKQVTYFVGLSYDVKRAKVLNMLKQLQGSHEIFNIFYMTISKLKNVSEELLVYVYQGIFEITIEIEAGNKNKAEDKIKNMAEVLMAIRKQEEMERIREENPDEILKNI